MAPRIRHGRKVVSFRVTHAAYRHLSAVAYKHRVTVSELMRMSAENGGAPDQKEVVLRLTGLLRDAITGIEKENPSTAAKEWIAKARLALEEPHP